MLKSKILVILGPTATGKSDLAVELAQKYDGEIISADSRQVYTGLNIGTGKITKKEMRGVPHYMLDIVSPKSPAAGGFSVAEWKKSAEEKIRDIISRGKLPIICGGTGFYIQSIVDNIVLPEVPPNPTLRKKLENKTAPKLFNILKKLDPARAETIDKNNPVRLIRAIEIAKSIGKVPALQQTQDKNLYKFLQIGLYLPEKELRARIHNRLLSRMKKGMIKEAENLHKSGVSWRRMEALGLEYRYLARFLQNKISKEEFIRTLEKEIWHYAKRQMTWFKRDKQIKWFEPTNQKIQGQVAKFIKI
jgi:tRNA dimethylallyltransferase